jgi:hypothetical protein
VGVVLYVRSVPRESSPAHFVRGIQSVLSDHQAGQFSGERVALSQSANPLILLRLKQGG